MKKLLITAIGSFSADNVIKTCIEAGYEVYGCDIYPAEWVASSKDVKKFFNVPKATSGQPYLDAVKEICREYKIDGILPLIDIEIDLFCSQDRENFPAKICISDTDTIRLCRDKYRMTEFLEKQGICRTIPGILLREYQDGQWEYPLIVKPVDGRSSQGLHRVYDPLYMEYVRKLCRSEAEHYLVQPMLAGDIITVDVVRNSEKDEISCLPRKELLRTLNGAGTSVYVFRDERLELQCSQIAKALGIRGCVNMEFVETAPGEYYFLECNPRFAGGVAFSREAGYDMVQNHMRCFENIDIQSMENIQQVYIARRYVEFVMN